MNLKDEDTIIVIDDDMCYNKFLFEMLYKDFIDENCEKFICVSGLIYPETLNAEYRCFRPGNFTQLMEAAFGYIIKKGFLKDDLKNWVADVNSIEEVKEMNFINSFLSDDYVLSRYLDTKKIHKKVLSSNFLVNKSNAILKSECVSTDSLGAIELNLNNYVRSELELKSKNLVI